MEWITQPEIWVSLLTLTLLEVILGIDNIVFISILAGKLPPEQRGRARRTGLILALISRLMLLSALSFIARLTKPLFEVPAFGILPAPHSVSGRDLVLLLGGLFLLWKSVREIHESLEGEDGEISARVAPTFSGVVLQILVIDVVFSLDSAITAIGMTDVLPVMFVAVILAMIFMLIFASRIGEFIHRHPSLKMLALSFLVLIGCALVAEGVHQKIPKGYLYFAMAFSVGVELLNIRARKKREPVALRQGYR